jgi:competence ComEA-like helix-hairpin-helix protein
MGAILSLGMIAAAATGRWLGESPPVTIPPDHFRVNINQASEAELRALPGIGPRLADRIVHFRQQNGPFGEISELTAVPGLGDKMLRELSPYLTILPE